MNRFTLPLKRKGFVMRKSARGYIDVDALAKRIVDRILVILNKQKLGKVSLPTLYSSLNKSELDFKEGNTRIVLRQRTGPEKGQLLVGKATGELKLAVYLNRIEHFEQWFTGAENIPQATIRRSLYKTVQHELVHVKDFEYVGTTKETPEGKLQAFSDLNKGEYFNRDTEVKAYAVEYAGRLVERLKMLDLPPLQNGSSWNSDWNGLLSEVLKEHPNVYVQLSPENRKVMLQIITKYVRDKFSALPNQTAA